MDIQGYFSSLNHLHDLQWGITVDRFKFMCISEGLKEYDAMRMYEHFMTLVKGNIPYNNGKPVTAEYMERVVDIAERTYVEYESSLQLTAKLHNFEYHRWGNDFCHAMFIFQKDKDVQVLEFNLASAETYINVSLLIKGGWYMKKIIRQCDAVTDTRKYLNFTQEERSGGKILRIYDGDVFELVPSSSDGYLDNYDDCGTYLCHNGAYRKLLYIPGKGYAKNKEPLLDDDVLEINIDKEGLFNSYKLTYGAFRKVGNINVDIGCLIEKPKDK